MATTHRNDLNFDPSRTDAGTPTPPAPPHALPPNKIFTAVILVVGVLFIVNSFVLQGMKQKVADEQRAAELAAKPAEVTTTLLTATAACPECFDITQVVANLKANARIQVTKEEVVEYTSDAGKKLVQQYGIAQVPALIIRGDTQKAVTVFAALQSSSQQAADGALVVGNLPPPYVEVASNAVRGKVTLTYLTNKGCQECYNVTVHRRILNQYVGSPEEKLIDRADPEGKRLIDQYKIDSLPTILVSGDVGVYPRFTQIWPSVGTVEKDGTYVFREEGVKQMGTYYDLKSRSVIRAAPEPDEQNSSAPAPAVTPQARP